MIGIEPTTAAEWPEVQALLRDTPMTASVPLAIERAGSEADSFPLLGGGKALSYVARAEGRVVGYVHAAMEDRLVLDDAGKMAPETLLFGSDLRVEPSFRRKGLAHQLLAAVGTEALKRGVERGFGYVNEGNRSALALREGLSGATITIARTFTTVTRMLISRAAEARDLPIVTPSERAFELLARRLSERLLAPVVTPSSLMALARAAPEIVWVGTPEKIDFALWDQHERRRLRVLGALPAGIAATLAVWRAASKLTGGAVPPGRGGSWRALEVSLVADPEAVERHAAAIFALAGARGAHFVNAIERGPDPSRKPLVWPGVKRRLRTQLLVFGMEGTTPPRVPGDHPIHVDLGFF